jgi:beta-lactamase regulating signal transducer with metallopeptidase domain
MTIAWMMYVLFIGALLSLGAWCLDEALRYAKLPTRWVWTAAMLGTIAFAGYALTQRNARPVAISALVANVVTTASPAPLSSAGIAATIEMFRATIIASMASTMDTVTARIPADVARFALFAWVAASVVLTFMHVVVNRRVVMKRREWPLATLPGGTARVSPTLGPAVIGLASPEIVVPQWLLEKSSEEQRLVMVHEQEHISARDQFLPVGALVVATLLPWHPAVWWSLARLRLAVELDCDARVLRRGEQAQSYGTLLIDIAAQCGGHRAAGALALADRTSHLERRIRAMTNRTSRFIVARTIGLASIAALAIITACEAKLPTSSEIAKMDVSAAEKAATAVLLPAAGGSTTYNYVVDDKATTEAEAHAIPGSLIASVSMAKPRGAEAGAKGLVTIQTKDYAATHPEASLRAREARGEVKRVSTDTYIPYGKDAPLVVVDGVIAEQSVLTKLHTADIASVEVLKGAAATAAWSHPAAVNGVITITTKHPQQ